METTNKFKMILMNMTQDEVLNFIWMYDQYVEQLNEIRVEEEDWNISTGGIELFYNEVYKSLVKDVEVKSGGTIMNKERMIKNLKHDIKLAEEDMKLPEYKFMEDYIDGGLRANEQLLKEIEDGYYDIK